jgi:hypothetical protein
MVLYDVTTQTMKRSTWDPAANKWTTPQEMGFGTWSAFATFSPDEKVMYYQNHGTIYAHCEGTPITADQVVTSMGGVQAGIFIGGNRAYFGFSWQNYTDLGYATYNPNDPVNGFGARMPVTEINTADNSESYPYVTPDGDVLLYCQYPFSSPGGWTVEIWKATWDGTKWVDPAPLGSEINMDGLGSAHPVYCPGNETLYFTQPDPSGKGSVMQAKGVGYSTPDTGNTVCFLAGALFLLAGVGYGQNRWCLSNSTRA